MIENDNNNNEEEVIHILWTGGWDSTYRIVELSREFCIIQPIYVFSDNRISEKNERRAMDKILLNLKRKKETKATFLPIKFIDKKSIPLNPSITKAYEFISKETQLGSQHEWLARLAHMYPGIEIGTEAAPLHVSNILKVIYKYGKLVKSKKDEVYILDSINSTNEVMHVLGNFKFPIIDKSGQDMKENIHLWGYEDVMKDVWVCHTPLYGKACGLCHPCELKIETGMSFLLSDIAIKRYSKKNKQPYKFLFNVERKISRKIEKMWSTD